MKIDGRLGRNLLKGALGDALHAVMCAAGLNLWLILTKLGNLAARFASTFPALMAMLSAPVGRIQFGTTETSLFSAE